MSVFFLPVQGAGYLQLSVGSTQQQSEGNECEVYVLSGANGTSQLREMLASSMSLRKEAEDEKKVVHLTTLLPQLQCALL